MEEIDMQLEESLKSLRSKAIKGKFSQSDAELLLNLVQEHPCNLPARFLLLELAQLHQLWFEPWTLYYEAAIATADQCWNSGEIAQIHQLAAHLYSYDQDVDSQRQAATTAFQLAPHDWRIVNAYIWYSDLPEDIAIPLIERLGELGSENPLAFYAQGRLFEMYADISGKNQHKEAAIKAYQRALDLGLSKEKHDVPAIAAENAIERLMSPSSD